MKFVTDLHLHSKYSRAVSQDMVLSKMVEWSKMKGINVLATGDFTHPFWFEQLKRELEETGNGLFRLQTTDYRLQKKTVDSSLSTVDQHEVYFLLSCEISSIYSQGGKTRRIHNLFFFPTLASVEKFNKQLLLRGANVRSDGRPIVGIPSRDLAKIALGVDDRALIIPAHVWTPWFSVFGSFSGFDSIEECFGDMAPYIYGIETGLSSDPGMNWQIADLDNRAILSFSDAHSLEKMGREATVFEAEEISYDAIYQAIASSALALGHSLGRDQKSVGNLHGAQFSQNSVIAPLRATSPRTPSNHQSTQPSNYPKIAFTIEFYPEEGKYHFTGHKDCGVSQSPEETAQNGDKCPVCGRQLTVGVMHRVKQLASREIPISTRNSLNASNFKFQISNGVRWVRRQDESRPTFISLVPLGEIIAEALGTAVKTKGVFEQYKLLVENFGNEFAVLLKTSVEDLKKMAHPKVVEGIDKVRKGNLTIDPGYDGKFGVVKIWDGQESEKLVQKEDQLNLFA